MSSDNEDITPMLHAGEGDRMRCSDCGKEVYVFTRDIFSYDRAEASQLKGINGFIDPISGDKTNCPNLCGNQDIIHHHEVVR